jgi:hypothetical protein
MLLAYLKNGTYFDSNKPGSDGRDDHDHVEGGGVDRPRRHHWRDRAWLEADIIATAGNPVSDITAVRRTVFVMKGGRSTRA